MRRTRGPGRCADTVLPIDPPTPVATKRAFVCRCGRPVFFRNSRCLACGTALGYDPEAGDIIALEPGSSAALWRRWGGGATPLYARCANFETAAACNWLLPRRHERRTKNPRRLLCRSCGLNRTIPDLAVEGSALLWGHVEAAKRRVVSSLLGLGLPVRSRVDEDLVHGLAFDLLRPLPDGPPVMTGHADGIITLNVEEADDVKRERLRAAMKEPYRTLLGHLRHELGHYYWMRLVSGHAWHEPFKTLFGDEQADYQAALKRHYESGPPADWRLRHVSAYASAHPWEDWAETWAHYLHMVDSLDTAASFGLHALAGDVQYEPFPPEVLYQPDAPGAEEFLSFVNRWVELTGVLNEMSRSMGQADLYPFVLSATAVAKLQFVHLVVGSAA